jgi:type I restriction enzyme S subunit
MKSKNGMIRFKPYPAYKDSGVEWLGKIPAHWEVRPLKYCCGMNSETLNEETSPDYELRYVDISNVDSTGNVLGTEELRFENAPSRARRKVRSGDTIISTVRTYLKAIAYLNDPPDNLIVSTGFAVLRPHPGLHPPFLWRVVQSEQFVQAVQAYSEGVGYPAINPSQLGRLVVWIPKVDEQRAIAAFLDRETAKIDALVAKKERLIELLQEKRAALITQAVTKGLDPTVPMKDSGVEWLGQTPAHWEVQPLRWALSVRSGEALDNSEFELTQEEGLEVAVIGGNGVMGYTNRANTDTACIAIGRVGALCGNVHLVEPPAWITDNALVASGIRGFDRWYLALLLRVLDLNRWATQNAQPLITGGFVKAQRVCAPPDAEQRAIAVFLDRETARIDALVAKVREGIEKLKEYRTALISAAVTGKIDVREVV